MDKENFKSFFSLGAGWGMFSIKDNKVRIKLEEGTLDLSEIGLPFIKQVKRLAIDGEARDYTFAEGRVSFAECVIRDSVEIIFE